MQDNSKRTVIAILLCAIVFLIYVRVFVPKPTINQVNQNQATQIQNQQANANNNTVAQNTNTNNNQNNPTQILPANQNSEVLSKEELQKNSKTFITPLVKMTISNVGGKIISLKLLKFSKELNSKSRVELIDVQEGSAYPLSLLYNAKRDDNLNYTISIEGNSVTEVKENVYKIKNEKANIILSTTDTEGKEIKKVITLYPESYLFDVSAPSLLPEDNVWIEWVNKAPSDNDRYNEYTLLYLNQENKTKKVSYKEMMLPLKDFGQNTWMAAGYKYFETALVPLAGGNNTRFGRQDISFNVGNYIMQGALDSSAQKTIKIYAGPRDHKILQETGFSLERSIDLGFFSIIAYPLLLIIQLLYKFLGNYGLAIVLLTLVIKMIFLPLTSSSIKSMKKMQDLQPKVKELRERIKNPNELNMAMMDLYKKNNVNPMGGCLPMLIQIPVFFGLYVALLNSISLRHSKFALWITDLSAPEKLQVFGIGIPVMILLMGASMFWQQKTTPSAMDPAQQKAMLITPIIFTVIFLIHPFPSGLVLYWLTNNLISIVQQKVLKAEGNKISPMKSTLIASFAIFAFAYILTLF